jgi:pimeloyl-ACP methyl ester carboxylesterase
METENAMPTGFHVDANGIRFACQDWGGEGRPIIILHATGFFGSIYRPIAIALRSIGHVFSYDQRGHGDSSRPADGDYSWAATTADLKAFIAAMKFRGVFAFGHSAGATAIGSLAGAEPGMIERAVMVEPVLFDDEAREEVQNSLFERTLKRKRWFESADAMYRNLESKPPFATWQREILRDYCENGTRPGRDGGVELKCPPEIEAAFYARAREYPGFSMVLRSAAPSLVMLGEKSDSTAIKIADKIAARMRTGTVVRIPDGTHFLPMEAPEMVAQMAIDFLSRESPGA